MYISTHTHTYTYINISLRVCKKNLCYILYLMQECKEKITNINVTNGYDNRDIKNLTKPFC